MTTTGTRTARTTTARAGSWARRMTAGALAAAAVLLGQTLTGSPAQALTNSFVTTYSNWSILTPTGIGTLDIPMSFTDDPGTGPSYFYNTQFSLGNGQVGYLGLQTDVADGPRGKSALFALFAPTAQPTGAGTPGPGARCINVVDGSPAMSCRLPYSWTRGHDYLMRVQRTATNTWTGTIIDRTTGTTSRIGTITSRSNTVSGTMGNFVEYYGPNFPTCDALALSRVTFGVPRGDGIAGALTGTSTGEGACRTQRTVTPLADGTVRHRIGSSTRGCGFLFSGFALTPGQSVLSCGGRYALIHQTDGNVVLYRLAVLGNTGTGTAIWATNTGGQSTTQLAMQKDGNLVLYGPGGAVRWTTFTYGNPGAFLKVQTDSNLVIYKADESGFLWTRFG